MRAVIQRVKSASVTVENKVVSQIGKGLLVLVGVSRDDTVEDVDKIVNKILRIKFWEDPVSGAMWKTNVADLKYKTENMAVEQSANSEINEQNGDNKDQGLANGQVLCVSQFTLLATVKKGAKPDFHAAAKGEVARELYAKVLQGVAEGLPGGEKDVKDGVFGAMMDVALVNDGPVTIELDTREKK